MLGVACLSCSPLKQEGQAPPRDWGNTERLTAAGFCNQASAPSLPPASPPMWGACLDTPACGAIRVSLGRGGLEGHLWCKPQDWPGVTGESHLLSVSLA